MTNAKTQPVCLVCGTTPETGMAGGIYIREKFMCFRCEQIIAEMEVEDQCYPIIKERLKNIWFEPVVWKGYYSYTERN